MKIELTLKMRGGSEVIMADGTKYHFIPDENDAHVAEVENPAHIARFMEVDGYVVHDADAEAVAETARLVAEDAARVEADRKAAEELEAASTSADEAQAAAATAAQSAISATTDPASAQQQGGTTAPQDAHTKGEDNTTLWTTELAALTHDQLKARFEDEIQRKPHHRAGPEKLIELIIEHRTAATSNED